jgi:D-arginine dehydrogenase
MPASNDVDVVVIGAGIAGAGAAAELAATRRVVLLERESLPGYHTTGRSAALYAESYGNEMVRAITTGSRAFYLDPPAGFAEHRLLTPRGALYIARPDQAAVLEQIFVETRKLVPSISRLTPAEAAALVPALDAAKLGGAVLEPDAMDMDVAAIHQGFLRMLRRRAGELVTSAEVIMIARAGERWRVVTSSGEYLATVVVNAAGAWCDEIGKMAGAQPIGLVPKRRTAFTFDPPPGMHIDRWPLVVDCEEQFYVKPEAGRLLGSPADETPSPPCDAQPEELDIAIAVERIENATTLKVTRLLRKWAGLRSFVKDKTLVAGFAKDAPGFFWLAGQGGYGIQTAPAMARIAAALATGGDIPDDLKRLGVSRAALDPARLQN